MAFTSSAWRSLISAKPLKHSSMQEGACHRSAHQAIYIREDTMQAGQMKERAISQQLVYMHTSILMSASRHLRHCRESKCKQRECYICS